MISVEKALNPRMFIQFVGTSHTDDEVHYVLRFLGRRLLRPYRKSSMFRFS
jgi:hypothetical protein